MAWSLRRDCLELLAKRLASQFIAVDGRVARYQTGQSGGHLRVLLARTRQFFTAPQTSPCAATQFSPQKQRPRTAIITTYPTRLRRGRGGLSLSYKRWAIATTTLLDLLHMCFKSHNPSRPGFHRRSRMARSDRRSTPLYLSTSRTGQSSTSTCKRIRAFFQDTVPPPLPEYSVFRTIFVLSGFDTALPIPCAY